MKRLSLLSLIFAVLFVVFFLLLIFLRIPFPIYPLMNWQDAIDILTPLVLIPIYWMMFLRVFKGNTNLGYELIFMVLIAFWASGQGMHLSANAINNLIGSLSKSQVLDVRETPIYQLTYFFDEDLSHYLWHIGILGLMAILAYGAWQYTSDEQTNWQLVVPAGILHGFTCFCIVLEGGTWQMGFPFLAILTLLVGVGGRGKLVQKPVLAFFGLSSLFASLLFIGWGLYWGGFPQFSEVGLI